MKKLAYTLLILLGFHCGPAAAQIIPSLPYNLTNDTLADANQVMANFNAIVTGTNTNAANAGANTNITALNGLTTPLGPSSGGSSVYTAGASTGTPNSQIVLNPSPLGYTAALGRRVTFIAGFTNTSTTVVNVNSTGATFIVKDTPAGSFQLSGGEIVAGNPVDIWYDGSLYHLLNAAPQSLVPACATLDYSGADGVSVPPSGFLFTDGAAKSRTTFATLFGCLSRSVASNTTSGSPSVVTPVGFSGLLQIGWYVGGTNVTCNSRIIAVPDTTHITLDINAGATGATTLTIGPNPQGDCSTTFNVPNYNGRATVGTDAGGSAITSATCTNPGTVGSSCGTQSFTLSSGNIPSLTSTNAAQNISVTVTVPGTGTSRVPYSSNGDLLTYSGTGAGTFVSIYSAANNWAFFTSLSGTTSNSISTTYTNASPSFVSRLAPIALVTKIIKF